MNKRGNPCPTCFPFVGKVLIDDVWSGGRKDGVDPETGKRYPLMSKAIEAGLYHPRCKDSHTTYFPGISTADDTWTKKERRLDRIMPGSRRSSMQSGRQRSMGGWRNTHWMRRIRDGMLPEGKSGRSAMRCAIKRTSNLRFILLNLRLQTFKSR